MRITEQARQILSALLENAGSVVTREELRKRLWPGGEFVNWDHSISNVVAQLRSTLRDNPKKNKIVETVPKRGYRLVVPVTFAPAHVKHGSDGDKGTEARRSQSRIEPTNIPQITEPEREGTCSPDPDQLPQLTAEARAVTLPPVSNTEVAELLNVAHAALPQAAEVPEAPAGACAREPTLSLSAFSVAEMRRVAMFAALLLIVGTLTAVMFVRITKRESSYSYASVGIPPFEASGEGSDSVAESFRMDLANAVSELPTVQVRAAHSFSAPLRDDQSIRAAAKSLKLDLLLFGKMTVSGDACVFHLEVVRGSDAVHLASFRYSGSTQELGRIRERIQRDLFDQFALAGQGAWRNQTSTPNPKAYQAYLQARLDLSGWSDAPVQKALEGFQKAIAEDPNFANAYAGLASSYVLLGDHGTAPFESSYQKAQEAATRAIELAPSTAEGHAIWGEVALRRDWNFQLAERELRRAVELDPNRAALHLWLSILLCYQSRFEEAFHEIDLARTADPFWGPVYGTEAFLATAAGRTSRAVQASERLTDLMPNWPAAYDQRGWAYWHAGRYVDALADWRHMAQMEDDAARIRLEDEGLEAFRRGGVPAYARVRLSAIQSGYPYRHAATDFVAAEWYSIAGDHDKAVSELEKMLARHDPLTLQLAANSAFLPLHKDPRFEAILTRAGLNQPKLQLPTQNELTNNAAFRDPARRQ